MHSLKRYGRPNAPPRLLASLTLVALLFGASSVSAQDNTNANANANANANTNTNTNANRNVNENGNTNANGNSNANDNRNTNDNSNRDDSPAQLSGEARKNGLAKSSWFYAIVSLMFAVVLIPFAWIIWRSIKFSRGTYGPLGLPEGSLRAILAYMLVAFVGFYVLAGILSISDYKPPEFLLGIVATVIGFYFGSRSGEERGGAAAAKPGVVQGKVKDPAGAAVANATVELLQSGVSKDRKATDAQGVYTFGNVPPGVYQLQATAQGGQPGQPVTVTVKAGVTSSVDLTG